MHAKHVVLLGTLFLGCAPTPSGLDAGTAGTDDAGITSDAGTDGGATDAGRSDAGDLHCDGGTTFREAKAAMLTGCGGFGPMQCHGRAPFGGELDLTDEHAWSSLVNVAATESSGKVLVIPGDPAGSFLVQKLTNDLTPDEGDPMPKGEGILWQPPDPDQLRVLQCWIAGGAPND